MRQPTQNNNYYIQLVASRSILTNENNNNHGCIRQYRGERERREISTKEKARYEYLVD